MEQSEILMSSGNTEEFKPIHTSTYLTKYEKARVLGLRATQIANGAPFDSRHYNAEGPFDPLVIAEQELTAQETPFIIRRFLPDGTFEDVAVNQLISLRPDA